jgi:hypothetical protein
MIYQDGPQQVPEYSVSAQCAADIGMPRIFEVGREGVALRTYIGSLSTLALTNVNA